MQMTKMHDIHIICGKVKVKFSDTRYWVLGLELILAVSQQVTF